MRTARVFLLALALGSSIAPLRAQITSTVTDISPDRSSFDPTDPDGASGGRVHNLGRAANGTTIFAASEWGGLFKSTDSGQNWAHLPGHVPHATFDVKVDPVNSSRVYATSFYDGRLTSISGINVSTNGGTTWSKPASATPPVDFCISAVRRDEPAAYGISVNPDNPGNVVIGTNCGVAISNNAGVSWTFVDPTPADGASDVWDVVVHHSGIIDTCGADGHRRSVDGGSSWTTASSSPLPSGRCSMAVSPDESYVLFAAVGTSLFESDDGGTSWPNTFTNPQPQGRIPFAVTNQRTGSAFDLWFGDVGLWRESCTTPASPAPGGTRRCPANSWSASFTRLVGGHDDVGDLIFATGAANDACPTLFSSDGGVYANTLTSSPNCHSPAWDQPLVTPHALWLMGMGGAHQNILTVEDLYFGAQDNGPFGTTDAQVAAPTWINSACCDSFDISPHPVRVVYTQCCWPSAPSTRLLHALPGMIFPTFVTTQPSGNIPRFRYVDAIVKWGPESYALVAENGIFTTTNITATPAVTWTQLGQFTSPANPRGIQLGFSAGTPTFVVQAGIADGRSADQLWRFTGTGAGSWTQILPPGGSGGFGIYAVDPNNPNRIVASHIRPGLDPQMIITTNGGTSWTNLTALDTLMTAGGAFRYVNQRGLAHSVNAINSQMGYPQPTFAAFDPEETGLIAAGGADSGVFVSLDSGTSWTLVTDPFTPAISGRAHIPRPRFAYFDHEAGLMPINKRRVDMYVGSQGRGVWRVRMTVPKTIVIQSFCELYPLLCSGVSLASGLIRVDCGDPDVPPGVEYDCVARDFIPDNCAVKFPCPGCSRDGWCPPVYRFHIDDLDPEIWEVGVQTRDGTFVDIELEATTRGVTVTFQPSEELFREGSIGEYELIFARRTGSPGQRYEFPTRLEVIDR